MSRDELLARIDDCRRRFRLSDTSIGLGALNDARFVGRLREGRRCWPETAQRVIEYLAAYEAEATRLETFCTQDGTWIAHDRQSGLAHSGRTEKAAADHLKRLLDGRGDEGRAA